MQLLHRAFPAGGPLGAEPAPLYHGFTSGYSPGCPLHILVSVSLLGGVVGASTSIQHGLQFGSDGL